MEMTIAKMKKKMEQDEKNMPRGEMEKKSMPEMRTESMKSIKSRAGMMMK